MGRQEKIHYELIAMGGGIFCHRPFCPSLHRKGERCAVIPMYDKGAYVVFPVCIKNENIYRSKERVLLVKRLISIFIIIAMANYNYDTGLSTVVLGPK